MKMSASITLSIVLTAALLCLPASLFGETNSFNSDGLVIDRIQYEIIVAEREKIIGAELENGYPDHMDAWKDPIKLRKQRIEQWQQTRSQYNPESLPHKIEN